MQPATLKATDFPPVVVPVGGRQARRILARLALGAHREVTVGALAQAAWSDHPPATARHTIATHVLRLRQAGLAIRTTSGGYCLDTPTDVEQLDLARATGPGAETSVRQWRRTLSLWRDRPFVDLDHVPEAVIEAARLEEAVETIREDLLAAELDGLAVGDADGPAGELAPLDLVGTARQLAEQQPYRERRRELLMLALYRAGRQAGALDAYAEARHVLVEDLGLEPGPSLRRMQHAVLSQDPALDVAARQENLPVPAAAVPGTPTLTEFSTGAAIAEEARHLFAGLGDPLGEGRALRRLGAISAATDDMVAARRWLEASLGRLEEAGVQPDIGTTLLHLGSLLADEGDVEAARPALARALAIATAGSDPLARAHALAALNLAHWKAGDLPAALSVGSEALNLFRELGHRPTEGTVAYRLAAVARGLGRPKAARRYALLARAAGEQSSTRSTVAMAEINLARLDLDDQAWSTAAEHLGRALAVIDPEADRWALVEALEAVARLAVGRGRSEAASGWPARRGPGSSGQG